MGIIYLILAILANIAVGLVVFLVAAYLTKDIQAAWQWMLIYWISGALFASFRQAN